MCPCRFLLLDLGSARTVKYIFLAMDIWVTSLTALDPEDRPFLPLVALSSSCCDLELRLWGQKQSSNLQAYNLLALLESWMSHHIKFQSLIFFWEISDSWFISHFFVDHFSVVGGRGQNLVRWSARVRSDRSGSFPDHKCTGYIMLYRFPLVKNTLCCIMLHARIENWMLFGCFFGERPRI